MFCIIAEGQNKMFLLKVYIARILLQHNKESRALQSFELDQYQHAHMLTMALLTCFCSAGTMFTTSNTLIKFISMQFLEEATPYR